MRQIAPHVFGILAFMAVWRGFVAVMDANHASNEIYRGAAIGVVMLVSAHFAQLFATKITLP